MSIEEYDPETCVTAGELRARGITLPDSIPDVGWAPRSSVHISPCVTRIEGDTLHVEWTVTFEEVFRWISCKVEIKNEWGAMGEQPLDDE